MRQCAFRLAMRRVCGIQNPVVRLTRSRKAEAEDKFRRVDCGRPAPTVAATAVALFRRMKSFGQRGIIQRLEETVMLLDEFFRDRHAVMRNQRRQQIIKEIQLGITAELRTLAAFRIIFAQQGFKIVEQTIRRADAIAQGENVCVKGGCDCANARVETAVGLVPQPPHQSGHDALSLGGEARGFIRMAEHGGQFRRGPKGGDAENVNSGVPSAFAFGFQHAPVEKHAQTGRIPKPVGVGLPSRAGKDTLDDRPLRGDESGVAGVSPKVAHRLNPNEGEILVRLGEPGGSAAGELPVRELRAAEIFKGATRRRKVMGQKAVEMKIHQTVADVTAAFAPRTVGVGFVSGSLERVDGSAPRPVQNRIPA